MLKVSIVLFSLLCLLSLHAVEKVIIRFDQPGDRILTEFIQPEFDVAAHNPGKYLDLVVDADFAADLEKQGYSFSLLKTEDQMRENLQLRTERDLNGYRTYDDVLGELQAIELAYPGLCKLYDIGNSQGKLYSDGGNDNYDDYAHEVWALKVSDNVEIEEDEPCVYYMATHHAREPISLEVAMAILYHILENYGTDPDITDNVNNTQIWFAPLVNPDGHKIVTDETDVWWRKNIRDNNENGELDYENWYGYPDGVDPNRNYSYMWGVSGTSSDPLEQTYCGPSPFSEPETQAMRDLVAAHNFVAGISYHSYGQLVLFPYGYAENIYAPDYTALSTLANAMAVTIPASGSGHYTPTPAWDLYPCSGTTDDWSYGVHGVFSFTIELATEFIPPAGQVEGICEDNIEAAMILLDRVNQSTLTGHITDAGSGDPMVAEIFVNGIDNSAVYRNPYTSDENFGRYYRMLPDGTYDVSFLAFGYVTETVEDVQITSNGQTVIDISLGMAELTDVDGTITDLDTNEPIAYAEIQLLETPLEAVNSDNNGYFTFEDIPLGTYEVLITAENYVAILDEITVTESSTTFDFQMQFSTAISFETGEFDDFWYFSGSQDWFIDDFTSYDGLFSARTGNIGSNQTTSLLVEVDIAEEGQLSFYKKVSCEDDYNDNWDYFAFFINGIEQDRWDGEVSWSPEFYDIPTGTHTFEWRYVKDGYVDEGYDCAWLDYIQLPGYFIETFYATPDSVIMEMGTDLTEEFIITLVNDGNGEVDYNIGLSEEVDWLIIPDPAFGTVAAQSQNQLSFTIDTGGLTPAEYTTEIQIEFFDAERSTINIPVTLTVTETANGNDEVPLVTSLTGNHPNPFNPETVICFQISDITNVKLDIYNLKGQLVKNLIDETRPAGKYDLLWDGSDNDNRPVGGGIYFYRLQAKNYDKTRKMVLLK